MKIEKIFNFKNRLLELLLLKFYFQNSVTTKINTTETIVARLKKILHIVYKYHILNKKILFINASTKNHFYIEKIIKHTKHITIPESVWINGLVTNKKSCLKYLIKNQIYSKNTLNELLLTINEPFDLVLIINNIKNKSLIKEILNSQIPVIYLNTFSNNPRNFNHLNYTLNIELKPKKTISNFFFLILKTIFKKTYARKFKFQKGKKNKK